MVISLFLLSMNEVNIKYTDFVISKKKIDFLDALGLLIGGKPIFTKKKIRLARFHGCTNENFFRPIFKRCFQVRDFSFWITEGIGLTGVSFSF
jgi:hypothetical protein